MASKRYGLYLTDLTHGRTDSHGIVKYGCRLARELSTRIASHERLVIYANAGILSEIGAFNEETVELRINSHPRSVPARLLDDHVLSWARAIRDDVDVLHFPKGHFPFFKMGRFAVVATVHDDLPQQYREGRFGSHSSGIKSYYIDLVLRRTLTHADHLITVSQFSRRQLSRRAVSAGNAQRRITVAAHGPTLPDVPYVPLGEREPVLVHIGSPLPHKASTEAIDFTSRYLRAELTDLRALILGRLTATDEVQAEKNGMERLSHFVSDQELARLLSRARALIFSSRYEGFGLPPVEALLAGTPVVYADAPAVCEILAGVPGCYRPRDQASFAKALDCVLALDDTTLRELRQRFRQQLTWATAAERTLKAYRALA